MLLAPFSAGVKYSRWTLLVVAELWATAGCYVTRPITVAPAPGTSVLLDLTDAGRQALGDRIGASATRVEGLVTSPSDTLYLLRVSSVSYLNGATNQWSGESLAVPVSLVYRARYRELSRGRTTTVGVGIAAAIAILIGKTNFLGNGEGGRVSTPPRTGGA